MPRRPVGSGRRQVDWKRLTLLTFALYGGLALVVLISFELVVPALASRSTPAASGFNYGAVFGPNFARPFGWILAGVIVVLAPLTLLFRAADHLGARLRDWTRGGASRS